MCGSYFLQQPNQPRFACTFYTQRTGLQKRRLNAQETAGDLNDQVLIEFGQVVPGASEIELLKEWTEQGKEWRSPVVLIQHIPMALLPFRVSRSDFIDAAAQVMRSAGNGHPGNAPPRLDPVPVPPVVFGILGVVIKKQEISVANKVKEPFPRKVIGLEDNYPLRFHALNDWP